MIMAIRANVALYFELKSQLAGMRPLLKYLSCRMVLSACLSQRFLLDVTIFDPDARFELLNLLIVVEMAVRYIHCRRIFIATSASKSNARVGVARQCSC